MSRSARRTRYVSRYRDRQVRAKSREVVQYHYDRDKPGKPLLLLIPGALTALGSLALIVVIAYQTWFEGNFDGGTGLGLIVLLAPIYIGGVFLFSYGYELYDIPKALRLTAIIVFITFAAVFMLAALGAVLGALSGGKKSSSSRASSSSSSGSSSGSVRRAGGRFFDTVVIGGPRTSTVTREIVREVPVEPPEPEPVVCDYCGRAYMPEETKYACPHCGAPAPVEEVPEE